MFMNVYCPHQMLRQIKSKNKEKFVKCENTGNSNNAIKHFQHSKTVKDKQRVIYSGWVCSYEREESLDAFQRSSCQLVFLSRMDFGFTCTRPCVCTFIFIRTNNSLHMEDETALSGRWWLKWGIKSWQIRSREDEGIRVLIETKGQNMCVPSCNPHH